MEEEQAQANSDALLERSVSRFSSECESHIEKLFAFCLMSYAINRLYSGTIVLAGFGSTNRGLLYYPSDQSLGWTEIVVSETMAENVANHGVCKALTVDPQKKVGPYWVDFFVGLMHGEDAESLRCVCVECDGHDFHERTKEQVSHDKAKDRFLQMQGYPVFRYSGSDIVNNGARYAIEVVSYLEGKG